MTVTRYTCTDIEAKATAARIEGNAVGGGKSSQKSRPHPPFTAKSRLRLCAVFLYSKILAGGRLEAEENRPNGILIIGWNDETLRVMGR